jgi:hypothetical protein
VRARQSINITRQAVLVLCLRTSALGRERTDQVGPLPARSGPFDFEIKGFMRDSPSKKGRKFMAKWICYGVAIGCGIGVAIGNVALGIGPGGAIGVAIGRSILKSRR